MRASDQERENAAARLGHHTASGRLSMEELTSRTEAAFAAKTRAELDNLFADLPPDREPQLAARARRGTAIHRRTYLLVCLGLVAIWAACGMGYFWPIWPIIGWGIGLASHYRETSRGRRHATCHE